MSPRKCRTKHEKQLECGASRNDIATFSYCGHSGHYPEVMSEMAVILPGRTPSSRCGVEGSAVAFRDVRVGGQPPGTRQIGWVFYEGI